METHTYNYGDLSGGLLIMTTGIMTDNGFYYMYYIQSLGDGGFT